MPSPSRHRRHARRSRLYWLVRRYGFVVLALFALAAIQLLGSGMISIDSDATVPFAAVAGVKWVVPQY